LTNIHIERWADIETGLIRSTWRSGRSVLGLRKTWTSA